MAAKSRSAAGSGLRSVGPLDSAVDRVAAEVRRAVLNGTLAPGSTFSITDLSAKLGVSHIPVREALRRLDADGLIVLRHGRSAMVSELSQEELRSVFRLRQLLEPDLAARSASMLTEADIEAASLALEQFSHMGHDSDGADVMWEKHHEVHLTLLRPAATPWDLRILGQLWHASDRYTRTVFDTYAVGDRDRESRVAAHRGLIAAARSGSPAELRMAVSEHLRDNEAACLAGISAISPHEGQASADLST